MLKVKQNPEYIHILHLYFVRICYSYRKYVKFIKELIIFIIILQKNPLMIHLPIDIINYLK